VRAHIWDFGGQDIYLGTHRLFLDERAIYIIGWSPALEPNSSENIEEAEDEDKPLAYWLDYVKSLAGKDVPVIVVQTRCDQVMEERTAPVPPDHGFERLRTTACSAKEDDLSRLTSELQAAARYLRELHSKVLIPSTWLDVRDRLREKRSERTMERDEFDRVCIDKHGMSSPGALLHYLHQAGEVFWRESAFSGKVILDQEWALRGLYALVLRTNVLPLLRRYEGLFTLEMLGEWVWNGEFSEEEQHMFLGMMEQCEFCFLLGGGKYIALDSLPSRITTGRKVEQIWRGAAIDVSATLRYDFLHRGVLHGMISAVGRRSGWETVYWKYGLCYFDVNAATAVKIDSRHEPWNGRPGAGIIKIEAAGANSYRVVQHLVSSIVKGIQIGSEPQVTWEPSNAEIGKADERKGRDEEKKVPFGEIAPGPVPGAEPATPRTMERTETPQRFLVIATEWFSRHGGISTFNRWMCKALAAQEREVVCAVISVSEEERKDALSGNVMLVAAEAVGLSDPTALLSQRLDLPPGFMPEVVIGHGRITGPAARQQVRNFYRSARRIHFFHMSPEEIEPLKEHATFARTAEERRDLERKLVKDAHLAVPVGPSLRRELEVIISSFDNPPGILMWVPGFMTPPRKKEIEALHCLVLGRVEDFELKGVDIAAAGVGRAYSGFLKQKGAHVALVVRGVPDGQERDLEVRLKEIAPGVPIRIRTYNSNQETIERDFAEASLVLMPSRSEGFGLVAVEAVSSGTPVLVSKNSGFAEWIETWRTREMPGLQSIVIETDDDFEASVARWAHEIVFVLRDIPTSFSSASELGTRLARDFTWENAAKLLLEELSTKVS
jgi:internalin A